MHRLLVLSLLFAAPAAADVRFNLEMGAFSRAIPSVDLADLAGETAFGAQDDQSPAALGLQLGFGVQVDALEAGLDVGVGAGGLDITAVEDRYFGARDEIGGGTTLQAGLHGWWTPALGEDWQLLLGPRGVWHLATVASGVGQATLTSIGLGGQLGFRWRSQVVSPTLDGHLQLVVDGLAHLPLSVAVRKSATDVVFESDAPEGVFGSWGLNLGYCLTFK
ncbi:MAG: hypothetical protein KC549_14175 [Myxococcales bacterium]|nr:hypothetical protein [Myxococcales bacterium]